MNINMGEPCNHLQRHSGILQQMLVKDHCQFDLQILCFFGPLLPSVLRLYAISLNDCKAFFSDSSEVIVVLLFTSSMVIGNLKR